MNINPDNPKWTAYVLGELSEAERAELEKELESSAAARELVDEIRMATALLTDEFAKETAVGLGVEQKRAIGAAAEPKVSGPWYTVRKAFAATAMAAAAILIIATISIPSLLRSRQAPLPATTALRAPRLQTEESEVKSYSKTPAPSAAVGANLADGRQEKFEQRLEKGQASVSATALGQVAQDSRLYESRLREAQRLVPAANSFANEKVLDAPGAGPAARDDGHDRPQFNTEAYDHISDNPFVRVTQNPLATFSIDVDTAAYANLRRFLTSNQVPPKDSVRIEEMINYFTYDYPSPTGSHPIAAYTEVTSAPWKPDHRLVRIGIKGKEIDLSKRPASNLVFLIDVSGSMATPEKLPLLKSAMKLMIDQLRENDRVAIVVYAGNSGLVLPSTPGDKKAVLARALDNLEAGGSTNGASGIQLAYDTATFNFIKGGVNRVILATDGDFNVGVTSQGDLIRLIEDKAKSGVFLSVLGFGMGNYKDSTLEKLADKGNGNYAYIDTLQEARKVLVEELAGTLVTIAKDVKIQIEFNPAEVNGYRLIGYENRILRDQDFNDDQKDAGDMGAGHAVTALFEVVPRGVEVPIPSVDPLKYQQAAQANGRARTGELLNLKIRYKEPDGATSQLMEVPVVDHGGRFNSASTDLRFAASVASFGMILRDSPHKGQSTFDSVIDMADRSRGADTNGYRDEFVRLVRKARALKETQ